MANPGSNRIDPEFHLDFLVSIQQQISHLCKNLTPARNHRTLELYAIFLAAVVFPELKGAKEWLEFAIEELLKNMRADFLADGVHCELSTDYHHIVLRNLLGIKRLAVLNQIQLPGDMDQIIKQALVFSVYVHKPDGFIPAISDGDTGDFRELLQLGYEFYGDNAMLFVATNGQKGEPPIQRSKFFLDSGYCLLRSAWAEHENYQDARYMFFDCGPLGAGNHGHLDLLNIEVAAYGRSLIVDPGRYTYDESGAINWRVLFRGTGYHNTVQVDGKNQTRYEPHIRKYKIQGSEPARELKAAVSLPNFDYLHGLAASQEYPVIHERKILFIAGEYWLICDILRADEMHKYDLRFHLDAVADQCTSLNVADNLILVEASNLLIMQSRHADVNGTLEQGFVSPSYGIKHPASIVNFSQQATNACFYTLIVPFEKNRPELSIDWRQLQGKSGLCPHESGAFIAIDWHKPDGLNHDEILVSHVDDKSLYYGEIQPDGPFWFRRTDDRTGLIFSYDQNSVEHERQGLL